MRPPLDVYDVLIHLNPKQVPLLGQAVDPPAVNFSRGVMAGAAVAESGGALPVVDYNPVALYLSELRVSPRRVDVILEYNRKPLFIPYWGNIHNYRNI